MLRYALKRLLTAIPTLFVIVTISFFLMRVAPGGPFNQEKGLNPVIKANLERVFHLDQPLWKQYLLYLNNLIHGDFGPSYNLPDFTVAELFADGLPISIQLGGAALFLALLLLYAALLFSHLVIVHVTPPLISRSVLTQL